MIATADSAITISGHAGDDVVSSVIRGGRGSLDDGSSDPIEKLAIDGSTAGAP